MKWWFVLLVFVVALVLIPKKTFSVMRTASENNSPERMKKLRAIKAKKAEDRNRSQMKKVA